MVWQGGDDGAGHASHGDRVPTIPRMQLGRVTYRSGESATHASWHGVAYGVPRSRQISYGVPRSHEAQQIIVEWAKQYANTGIDEQDAEALAGLGDEAGLRCRGPEKHEKGKLRNRWHIHIGPINHIPLK